MRIGRLHAILLLGGPLIFLTLFFILPFALMMAGSAQTDNGQWTAAHYVKLATDTYYWRILLLTFEIGLEVTLICFALGYPLAYFLTFRAQSPMLRRSIYVVLVTPLFTNNVVRAFGWIVMLGRNGLVNQSLLTLGLVKAPLPLAYSKTAIVVSLAYTLMPFMVLTVASVLQNLDRSLVEAARDLGANPWLTFLKVTFPLSLPGVIAGSLIIFTLTVSAYVTPSIMSGGRQMVMSMLIFQQYMVVFDFNFGAALSVLLLAMTLLLILAYVLVLERRAQLSG